MTHTKKEKLEAFLKEQGLLGRFKFYQGAYYRRKGCFEVPFNKWAELLKRPDRAIEAAFDWSYTEEGIAYWRKIAVAWRREACR